MEGAELVEQLKGALEWRIALLSAGSGLLGAIVGAVIGNLATWKVQSRELRARTAERLHELYGRWFVEYEAATEAAYRFTVAYKSINSGDAEAASSAQRAEQYGQARQQLIATANALRLLESDDAIAGEIAAIVEESNPKLPHTQERATRSDADVTFAAAGKTIALDKRMSALVERLRSRAKL